MIFQRNKYLSQLVSAEGNGMIKRKKMSRLKLFEENCVSLQSEIRCEATKQNSSSNTYEQEVEF